MEEIYSPYCSQCEACGESGCCSHLQCFLSLIDKNKNCDYGERYFKDAKFAYSIAQLGEEVINKLENGLYDSKLTVEEFRKEWNIIYDRIYTNEVDKDK